MSRIGKKPIAIPSGVTATVESGTLTNRCELTGRSRAYYRKFRLSRIMLRELANKGLIPGVTKSSW